MVQTKEERDAATAKKYYENNKYCKLI